MKEAVPFNQPFITGNELAYLEDVCRSKRLAGDGSFTKQCQSWLEEFHESPLCLLTHTCTAALELSALLLDLKPGDEVIMPSFTFVSTASSFALRGAVPVFVDIRPDTLNLDENLIEDAITPKTRAICVVHYAGVSCEMDKILEIAKRRNLQVVEDAAHSIFARYKGRPTGAIGTLGCFSFHETKNIVAGEGGALLVNDPAMVERAKILWHKGTNRSQLLAGLVDKYTWMDLGSSYPLSELAAGFLWAQLSAFESMQERRMRGWSLYHERLADAEGRGVVRRPIVPDGCEHNAHIYYLLLASARERPRFIAKMKERGIGTPFHYVPLHSSPAGLRYGRTAGKLPVTDQVADSIVRLPLSSNDTLDYGRVADAVRECLQTI